MLPTRRLRGLAGIFIACIFTLSRAAGQALPPAAQYSIKDLGALSGGVSSATALNKYGDVIGTSVASGSKIHAVLYRSDIGALQELSDGENDAATGINDAGQVTFNYNRISFPFYGYLWDRGTSTLLTDGQQNSVVTAGINNAGQIAGSSAGSLTLWESTGSTRTYVVGNAVAINDAGIVVGSRSYGGDVSGPVWWTKEDGFHPLAAFYEGPAAINRSGQVTGGANYSQAVRNGYPQHAFVTLARADARPGDLVDIGTLGGDFSYGYGLNNVGQVVGSSNLVTNGPRYAFLWQSGHMADLNTLIPASSGWTLTDAKGINDYGQVCGTGINPDGKQHAYLLTPVGTHISDQSVPLIADYPGGGTVDGIVCDNLPNMDPSLLDRIKITVPGYDQADFSDSKVIGSTPGRLDANQKGVLYYYPPDEFNVNQTPSGTGDLTKEATRQITLVIRFKSGKDAFTVDPKQITLARSPVVLVHGINSSPLNFGSGPFCWQPLRDYWNRYGLRIPVTAVDHWDPIFRGNGPVETAASDLSSVVANTLFYVRNGQPIPFTPLNAVDFFTDLANGDPSRPGQATSLAIRRVDIVGWSYGGVIARWYIASDGTNPSMPNNPGKSWYQRLYGVSFSSVPTYANTVRKLFTLGSMWRGVPLINYLNEITFDGYPSSSGIYLGNAPLNLFSQAVVDLLGFPHTATNAAELANGLESEKKLLEARPKSRLPNQRNCWVVW